jgi:response regulator RpfG family c-di-GMP phosphodiesterase
MPDKILLVDDDPAVLAGYRRSLYKDQQPDTATSGSEALEMIASKGPYAVVVSDMRMPGMDGVRFLSQVSKIAPDTVRVILTGYADFQSAMGAVNEGKVFRFLTKPCEGPILKQTLNACIEQRRLILAEKDILQRTLVGCIEALTGVLSMANPGAYSKSVRVRRYTQQLTTEMKLSHQWKFEMAALLSQLGCVTVPPDILTRMLCGEELSDQQRAILDRHPLATRELLEKIPRLEDVAWIIAQQRLPFGTYDGEAPEQLKIGAEILRVAIGFDNLRSKGIRDADAKSRLKSDSRIHPNVAKSLACLQHDNGDTEVRTLRISELSHGMVLQEDVRTSTGVLLVVRGQEITAPLIVCLTNFQKQKVISDKVLVECPRRGEVAV